MSSAPTTPAAEPPAAEPPAVETPAVETPAVEALRPVDLLVLAIVALLPVLPALLGGAEAYLDNPSHLVEVKSLATEILPVDHWFSGWTERASAGMAINQMNAPLPWVVCGALAWLGLPLVGVYRAAILVSNVVFAFGALRLGRRLLPAPAAWCGAALAALALPDLYGYAGAVGGMWPHRLANGLLFWGLARRDRSAASIGVWLAAVLLCHTYSGMAAAALGAAVIGVAFVRGERGRAARWMAGAALGAAISSPFWAPLVGHGLDPEFAMTPRFWAIQDTVTFLLFPLDPVVLNDPLSYHWIGGILGFPAALLTLWALRRAWRERTAVRDPAAWRLALALLGALFLLVGAVVPLTEVEFLGPNPYRHLTLLRTVLLLYAGLGVAAWIGMPRFRIVALAFGVLAAGAGADTLRLPFHPERQAVYADLLAAWDDLAALAPQGRVYQVNTALRDAGPGVTADRPFLLSQVGSLINIHTDLPYVGTWYTISLVASEPYLRSANNGLIGRSLTWGAHAPRQLAERCAAYGIGWLVSVDPEMREVLATNAAFHEVSRRGDFSVWQLPDAATSPLEGSRVRFDDITYGRGRITATVTGAGPFHVRETWHPWWKARVGDRVIGLARERETGLVAGMMPGFGPGVHTLEIAYEDPSRWTGWVALAGLVGVLLAAKLEARLRANTAIG